MADKIVLVDTAVTINSALKRKRKQIDLADLFIAATAVAYNLPVVTLNRKHFERIDTLKLIDQGEHRTSDLALPKA